MYAILRSLLFSLPPEQAHALALSSLRYVPSCCFKKPQSNPVHVLGMSFAHPVGLAAGLDKNGEYVDALARLGFAFIEVGTVTPKPQAGNPKPRLFRVRHQQALINRMGFNNQGVDALVRNLERATYQGIVGINIGKNKDTPLQHAVEDYVHCLKKVYAHAAYVTINISSPNTPELRKLQDTAYLQTLITALKQCQTQLAEAQGRYVPLVVKVSPDETQETLKRLTEVLLVQKIDGIIATNTLACDGGGLSGRPLAAPSTHCLRLLAAYAGNDLTLIGVGGIRDAASAQEKLDAGAQLVQLYTGLIYEGPGLVCKVVAGLPG